MIRAYLFALDPTPSQAEQFRSHCGAARFAYNWSLARVKANWSQRAAEQTYGIAEEDRTPWVSTSMYSLRKAWIDAKDQVAPWWPENSKESYQTGCANLATALVNRRAGRARMPRFKSRRGRLSCKFADGENVRLSPDRRHVTLPRIGPVRTAESTRKLTRRVEAGTARLRSATLSYQRGRWHLSLSVEITTAGPEPRDGARHVGVDLGLTHWATLSDGERVLNRRRLDQELAALRRAERASSRRRGPDRRTGVQPSNRWHKARRRVDRIHTRIANRRRDDTHKLTTRLVREHDVIVIEDLHVAGMLRNRRLARHIAGANWAEIRRQLTYKCAWRGAELIVADRWFASSKTCSGCGTAKAKLALSERTYVCTACGLVLDRDVNAARNLAALANEYDTGELRREQPDRTSVRPASTGAARPLREGSSLTQRHRREAMAQ